MKNTVDKVTILDVIMVDNWGRIKEKFDRTNHIRLQRKKLLCLVLTFFATCFFVAATLKHFGGYIQEEIVIFMIWCIYIFVFASLCWKVLGDFVASAIDTLIVRNGKTPIFSKCGDLGVNLSYMLNKYPSTISYYENKVEIIIEKNVEKAKEEVKIYLVDWSCQYQSIKKPTLDLNNMKIILPIK